MFKSLIIVSLVSVGLCATPAPCNPTCEFGHADAEAVCIQLDETSADYKCYTQAVNGDAHWQAWIPDSGGEHIVTKDGGTTEYQWLSGAHADHCGPCEDDPCKCCYTQDVFGEVMMSLDGEYTDDSSSGKDFAVGHGNIAYQFYSGESGDCIDTVQHYVTNIVVARRGTESSVCNATHVCFSFSTNASFSVNTNIGGSGTYGQMKVKAVTPGRRSMQGFNNSRRAVQWELFGQGGWM